MIKRFLDTIPVPKEYLCPMDPYLRQLFRKWGEEYVRPNVRKYDEDWLEHKYVTPAVEKLMVDIGFQRIPFPKKYGGLDLVKSDYMSTVSAMMLEEVCMIAHGIGTYLCGYFWPFVAMLASPPFYQKELLKEFAPIFCQSEKLITFGVVMTEPQGGSDIENIDLVKGKSIRTTAELDGDEWVINGHKLWPTNCGNSGPGTPGLIDFGAVYCTTKLGSRDPKDVAVIMVPMKQEGVTQGVPYKKAGCSADKNSDVWFEDVRVPKRYRFWGPGKDFDAVKNMTQYAGFGSGALAVGAMAKTCEILKKYGEERTFAGRPLKEHYGYAGVLGDIISDLIIDRLAVYQCTRMLERPDIYGDPRSGFITGSMKALKNRGMNFAVADLRKAMDILGLCGCDRDKDIEKLWRDIKISQLWTGGEQLSQIEGMRPFFECEML